MPKPHHKRPLVVSHLGLKKKEVKRGSRQPLAAGPFQPKRPLHEKPKKAFTASPSGIKCMSTLHNHAALAVKRMVESRGTHLNLKSLTLAAHVDNKKAVHAVTCQVLKYL